MGGTITDFIYKLAALRQQFGLTPHALLATTEPGIMDRTGRLKSFLLERARQFNLQVLPLWGVKDLEESLYCLLKGRG